MLSALRDSNSEKVYAPKALRTDGPFSCEMCSDRVVLKKGTVRIHHFAHKPPYECSYGKGESEEHRKCKIEIFNYLSNLEHVTKCEMERNLGSVRPDVSCYIGDLPVSIEVQISTLSLEEIIYRTTEYRRKGIYVIWLPRFTANLCSDCYAPRVWEKWLHTTYFGRVYYWFSDLTIRPVHFDDHFLWVEQSSWYETGGIERSEGGYYRPSKRFRTPVVGKPVNLGNDFKGVMRSSLMTKKYTVPESLLLIDKQPNWWKVQKVK